MSTISQPKGYSMFCAKDRPDFEKLWRETQEQFNKMEARAIQYQRNANKLAESLRIARNAFTHSPDGVIRFSDSERCQIREALAAYESEAQ